MSKLFGKCELSTDFEPPCFGSKGVLIKSRNLYPNPAKIKFPESILAQKASFGKAVHQIHRLVAVYPPVDHKDFWPRSGWIDRRDGRCNESTIAPSGNDPDSERCWQWPALRLAKGFHTLR